MVIVIATFEEPRRAAAFGKALRDDFGVTDTAIGEARVAAYGEPHDGYPLVAAWVPRQLGEDVRALAKRHGGVLHEPPASIVRPAWVTAPRSVSEA